MGADGGRMRAAVLALHDQGLDRHEIAERLGINESTARMHARNAGVTLRCPPTKQAVAAAKLRRKIVKLHKKGLYLDEVASKVGLTDKATAAHLRGAGFEPNRRPNKRVLNRQAQLAIAKPLFMQNKSLKQVAQIMNVDEATALRYKRELNMVKRGQQKPVELATIKRVVEMMEDRAPPSEIRASTGVSARWLGKKFPEYKYSELEDVIPIQSLKRAFNRIPDTLQYTKI